MRYELKRNTNGQIQQCDNADGNDNVYAKRPELRKLALENLGSGMSGELGKLSNFQFFNFELSAFSTGTVSYVNNQYNQSNDFPTAVTDSLMFGVDSATGKALYYNIAYVNARLNTPFSTTAGVENLIPPSFISFYPLQNIETSGTGSVGTKIPHPSSQFFTSGGTVSASYNGNEYGNQSFGVDVYNEAGTYAQNNKLQGIRCSGIALKQILLVAKTTADTSLLTVEVEIAVDTSSVSSSY